MDFEFSETQRAIRELAREILAAEATPQRVKQAERSPAWRDAELWQSAAEANLLGIAIPEAQGGMGMGFAELCVLLEEVGRATAPGPWHASLVQGALPLAHFGSDAQQKHWLPKLASGEASASAALDEASSPPAAARGGQKAEGRAQVPPARARAQGTGFVIEGSKQRIPFADSADVLLLSATLEDEAAVFLLDPRADGVELSGGASTTGEPLFELTLHEVALDPGARLPCKGVELLAWLRPRAQAALCAMQTGAADRAIEITADYTRTRQQFGAPIGSFQAVQHRQADAFIDREALRWTTWRAVSRLAAALPAGREVQVARYWAVAAGSRIANACVHLHGGMGADVDYPIHRYFLWSKSLELQLGGEGATLAELGRELAQHGLSEESW